MNCTASRRTFLKGMAGLLGGGLLAACAPTSAPVAAPEPTKILVEAEVQPPSPAAPQAEEGIFWGLKYDPHVEANDRLIALFEKKSGNKLRHDPQAWPLETKLIAALSAGTQPDIVNMMGRQMAPLFLQKAMLALDETVYEPAGAVPFEEYWASESIECYTWEGKVYGVPVHANCSGVLVNVPMHELEKEGLANQYPPGNGEWLFESYEQLWELAKKLQTEEDGHVSRWGLSSNGWDVHTYLGVLRTLLAERNTNWWDPEKQQFNIDTEEGVEAMRLHAETPVKMGIETLLDMSQADAGVQGKVAIARGVCPHPFADINVKEGFNWRSVAQPRPRAGVDPLFVGEGCWGMTSPAEVPHPDLAISFLQMMCTEEAQREWAKIYGGEVTVAWKGLAGKFDHFADSSPTSIGVSMAKLFTEHISPRTQFLGFGWGYEAEVTNAATEVCSQVRSASMTAEEACRTLQERCESQYKQYLEDVKQYSCLSCSYL
ncbi:MAG: extracellular solute-binding protein [Anaerolineae bacterium]